MWYIYDFTQFKKQIALIHYVLQSLHFPDALVFIALIVGRMGVFMKRNYSLLHCERKKLKRKLLAGSLCNGC